MADDDKTDYISSLPDAILCVILSYLPTLSAISTAQLSKRWRYVWTKLPAIDLKVLYCFQLGKEYRDKNNLVNSFLNRVVHLNDVSCLDLFAIEFYVYDDESLDAMNSLLHAFRYRNFCELDLKIRNKGFSPLPLPKEFLSSHRLMDLKLDGLCLDDSQVSSFHLPNLETVRFGRQNVFSSDQFLKRFLLGCPSLKKLYISGGRGLGHIHVESSTLVSLEIEWLDGGYEPPVCVTIKALNLRNLILHRAAAEYDIIGDLILLAEADIFLPRVSNDNENLVHLTKKVSAARSLHLGVPNPSCCVEQVTKFENLTQLKFTNDGRAYELLKRAPKLKSLIFNSMGNGLGHDAENSWNSEGLPDSLSCLENVELAWFMSPDTDVAQYILKNGTALKEVRVMVWNDVGIEYCKALHRTLAESPPLSPVCQIKVVQCNCKGRPFVVVD